MDLWVREARLFKYGSGTGSNFSEPARRQREAVGRRQVVGPDELPEDRRSRRRRHQVGRHDAPRREDGRRRRRSSGHRGIHQLEGEGGAEGRRPRHRLEDLPEAPAGRDEGLRQLRCGGRRAARRALLRPGQEPGPEARHQGGAPRRGAEQLHPARHPVRQAGLQGDRVRHLRHRLGFGSLSHRLGPELQQLGARHRRVPQSRRGGRRLGSDAPPQRQAAQDAQGARPVGPDRSRRVGLGRSRHPVPHHHQRLAHLPEERPDPRLQPVLGVHVPRRHGVQPRLRQPDDVPQSADGRVRRHRLRARLPPVDGRARDLGADGAVPLAPDRRAFLSLPHARPRLRQHRRPADGRRHRL